MSTPPRRRDRGRVFRRSHILLLVLLVIVAGIVLFDLLHVTHPRMAVRPRARNSLLDISTPVNVKSALAHPSAIVHLGDARIEVLSPTLMRLEYSPSGVFENSPTVNVVDRRMPVPKYTTEVSAGSLTLRTSQMTLRYKVGSGPFTPANTSVSFSDGDQTSTVHPTWDWECTFDETCQAGSAVITGGASIIQDQTGYESSGGYVGNLYKGDSATWNVLGGTAGRAVLSFRYSNVPNLFGPPGDHTIDLVLNGHLLTTLAAPATGNSSPWSTVTTKATLKAGSNSVKLLCSSHDTCDVEVDTLSVGPADAVVPTLAQTDPLGGWIRGFDSYTYLPDPLTNLGGALCSKGTNGATCHNLVEPLQTDGLLDRAGWRLLDDTQSAIWTKQGWVQPRSPGGDIEDGYLFAYGQNYVGALRTFSQLTGSAPLLPRSVFGVWYSDYTPYSSSYIEDSVYSGFEDNDVPLNTLSLDTDWKAPNPWDGWEWNPKLFPDPSAFLRWAHSHGIAVTLNIHSSIADNDPKLPEAERLAKTALASFNCGQGGPCKVWDWSSESQAESNFSLQESFQEEGVAFWWLDWCCDDSIVSMPGVTPDSWIDHLYAQQMLNQGERGFVLARIGASNGDPEAVYPAGPWSDHTSTIAFTGDAWGTWTTLAEEVQLTPAEATIGEPYVSDDIGSYLGPPPNGATEPQSGTKDPPDLYDRWVQFGTFQPIMRLHSNDENRLPWEYPEPVSGITEDFLRLREALLPYTYTLAAQAHQDGMPITEPLYLDYPGQAQAYVHPDEYLYGSDVLVAPVITPGSDARTSVWIPPGRWIDYFTGATFTGPSTTTVSEPLSRMPVFVRAGGIIPEQTSSNGSATTSPTQMDVKVFSGATGTFTLYEDSGSGLGYTEGQFTETQISDSLDASGQDQANGTSRVTIGAAHGHFPGKPVRVSYRIELIDATAPSEVTLNGKRLESLTSGANGPGWYYEAATSTVVITTSEVPTSRALTVVTTGGAEVMRTEPPVAAS
jgi:hypothetical protein